MRDMPGAGAAGGTGGGLDEGGDGRNAHCATDGSSRGVDDEDLLDVLDVAILGEELTVLCNGHSRAHGIEEVRHHEREGEHEGSRVRKHLEQAHGAVLVCHERSADRGEVERGDDALRSGGNAQRDSDQYGNDDAEEDAAVHVECRKD